MGPGPSWFVQGSFMPSSSTFQLPHHLAVLPPRLQGCCHLCSRRPDIAPQVVHPIRQHHVTAVRGAAHGIGLPQVNTHILQARQARQAAA
jgi:hypothetical protein